MDAMVAAVVEKVGVHHAVFGSEKVANAIVRG